MSRLQAQLGVPTGGFTGASGNRRLFADQTYHFQALRVLNDVADVASGGAEHCQMGASTLWHETFFDWLLQRFPGHAKL